MSILQVFDSFFEESSGDPDIGDIYWVPAPYFEETPRVLNTTREDIDSHATVNFVLERIGRNHFQGTRDLPLALLRLDQNEELMALKSKKRPAIVIAKAAIDSEEINNLPEAEAKRAKVLRKSIYIVAPMYSSGTMSKPTTFTPELVARVEQLMYRHLFCIPDFEATKPAASPRSIVRLDKIHPSHLGPGRDPAGVRLSQEVLPFFQEIVASFLSDEDSEELAALRDLVQSS